MLHRIVNVDFFPFYKGKNYGISDTIDKRKEMILIMKKNIAIIGASALQLPLIERAKELGYVTHVFAWKANDVGEEAADFFYPLSIIEKELILDKCKDIGICGICSISSDLAAVTVNYVAASLGLSGNSMEVTMRSTNKHLMRLALTQNGDPSPKSYLLGSEQEIDNLEIEYPIIVKPTDRSGSRGITKLDSSKGLKEAYNRALAESFENEVLVEEFVEGKEYSVECISYHGNHHFLALTEKFTTGAPNFIETGHFEPASVTKETLNRIIEIVFHALDTLGIQNSASHSEIMINDNGEIKIIEIGGRMGGDCIGSDLVKYSTGVDYVRAVIQVACGLEPDLTPICKSIPVEVRFIFSEADIDEYERIKAENRLIRTVYFHPDNIGKITDSSNRAGCYVFRR